MTTKDAEYWQRQYDLCKTMYLAVLANYVSGDTHDMNHPETRHERLFHWLGKLGEAERELHETTQRRTP